MEAEGIYVGYKYYETRYYDSIVNPDSGADSSAGATQSDAWDYNEEVTITVPTKYLASYDYTNAKTYILDDGDYIFTAAAGAHEAINNILAEQGYTEDDGMDADGTGDVQTWNLDELDNTTFAVSNDTEITNVADSADLNYWTEEDTVTYLTRQAWEGTWPVNYNEVEINIGDSPKSEEWIAELRGETYTIQDGDAAAEAVDNGVRFHTDYIQQDQMDNVEDEFWTDLTDQISIDEAVGGVIHGGSQSDIQTLMGSSFNPELAYEWGRVEGNTGLWLQRYQVWGTGLTQRRTPYNGRNYEYISEDPMLTNRIGYGILQGCADMGIMNGPKHMGFNDQEHNRAGISAYMNEQKFRETDLRCFQGGLEDADGMAVMIAFNRIGATNASHYAGMLQNILRGEWGYTGLISTDMMNNNYYFNPESMIMAGITQVADFATNDNHINMGVGGNDATWAYISEETVANDAALVDQARENLKYQLYTFANSAVMNVSTERVQTWWDTAISTVTYASGVLAQMKLTGMAAAAVEIVSGILRIAATVLLTLCLVTLITARVEGLGFIYFSNADVLQEVQTPANMSSAAGTIANMICLGAATVFSMIAAFFNLRKKETQN